MRICKFKVLLLSVIAVFVFYGCKQPAQTNSENKEFTVTFGAADGKGGKVTAVVDGVLISSGDLVGKGKTVIFTAEPDKANGYEVKKWYGAEQNKTDPLKAELKVEGTADVKVQFSVDPKKLILKSLKVKNAVADLIANTVIVPAGTITAGDIEAKFVYGSLTDAKKIDVTVSPASVSIAAGQRKELRLSITADPNGEYEDWELVISAGAAVDKNILDTLYVFGGNEHGQQQRPDADKFAAVLAGEDVVFEIKGPYATVLLASKQSYWTKVEINGAEARVIPYVEYESAAEGRVELPAVGKTVDVCVKIKDSVVSEKAEVNFKIKRMEGKVDIPTLELFVHGKDIAEPDDLVLLHDSSQPGLPSLNGYEPTAFEVFCDHDFMESVVIDGQPAEVRKKKNIYGGQGDIYFAEAYVRGVKPDGKNITVTVVPKNKDDYFTANMSLNLKYNEPEFVPAAFIFNKEAPSKAVSDDINNGGNPLITVKNGFLNLALDTKIKPEKITVNGVNVTEKCKTQSWYYDGARYALKHFVDISGAGTDGKQITVVYTPEDYCKYKETTFKFKVKGGGEKDRISPKLIINDNGDLPKSVTDNLMNAGSPPLIKIFGASAKVQVSIIEYENDFLIKEIKINGEKLELEENPGFGLFQTTYVGTKEIPVTESSASDIRVEFIPKAQNMYDDVTWNFKVQGGGKLPPLPKKEISIFTINGFGKAGARNSFTKDFYDNLTEENIEPTYIFDGETAGKVEIKIGASISDMQTGLSELANVKFTIDSGTPVEVAPVKEGEVDWFAKWISSYETAFPDDNEHTVKIEMFPRDTARYSELVYTFKLKNSKLKPQIPGLTFFIDTLPFENNYKDVLNGELARLEMNTYQDTVEAVEIGEEGGVLKRCKVFKNMTNNGFLRYYSSYLVNLPTDGSYKKYVIKVIPKDKTKYRESTCTYELTGTAVADNIALFIGDQTMQGTFVPFTINDVTFYDNKERPEYDSYGAKKVNLTMATANPRATVKYKFVNLKGDILPIPPAAIAEEKTMTGSNGIYNAEFDLYPDKPTHVLVYVIAPDGTKDDTYGQTILSYNPIVLKWDTEAKDSGGEFSSQNAYGIIQVDKSSVPDNKIYAAFGAWKQDYGYTVNADDPVFTQPPYAGKPEKLDEEQDVQWYRVAVDISGLTASNELEIALPILENGVPCFTYKVKIRQTP